LGEGFSDEGEEGSNDTDELGGEETSSEDDNAF